MKSTAKTLCVSFLTRCDSLCHGVPRARARHKLWVSVKSNGTAGFHGSISWTFCPPRPAGRDLLNLNSFKGEYFFCVGDWVVSSLDKLQTLEQPSYLQTPRLPDWQSLRPVLRTMRLHRWRKPCTCRSEAFRRVSCSRTCPLLPFRGCVRKERRGYQQSETARLLPPPSLPAVCA